MRRPSWTSLATALALLTAACAPALRWDKAGASDDDIALAQQDCRSAAAAELRSDRIFRTERFYGRAIDATGIDPADQMAVERRFQEADYHHLQAQLLNDCMQGKGYRQFPADAPTPQPKKPQPPFKT